MVESEIKPNDIILINQQAEATYLHVAEERKVSPKTVHTGAYCRDFTKELGSRLAIRWTNLQIINNFDDTAGFGSGEVPSYGHSFIDLGNNWVVDPGWQLFLDPSFLQKLTCKLFPLPKVLVTPKQNILQELRRLGVNTYFYSRNWHI